MTKREKMFLAWIFLTLLFFVSPNGNDMTAMQWVNYLLGIVACIAFVVTDPKE